MVETNTDLSVTLYPFFFSMCRRNNMFRQGGGLKGGVRRRRCRKGAFLLSTSGKASVGSRKGRVGWDVCSRAYVALPSSLPFLFQPQPRKKRERNINGGRVGLLLLLKAPPPHGTVPQSYNNNTRFPMPPFSHSRHKRKKVNILPILTFDVDVYLCLRRATHAVRRHAHVDSRIL